MATKRKNPIEHHPRCRGRKCRSYGQPLHRARGNIRQAAKSFTSRKENGRNGAPGHSPSSFSLTASLTALSI